MTLSIRHLLSFLILLGPLGLLAAVVADDSFLFLPIGGDLIMVLLVARNHAQLPIDVIAGAAGSVIGVFFLDLVCRKGGEAGLKHLMKPKMLSYLKQKMERHAGMMLVVSCIAPPPFPFGAAIAAASAFQYPRVRLLVLVFFARAVRFALVGWAAVYFGRHILRIAKSPEFLWAVGVLIVICVVGSAASVLRWVRIAHSKA